MKRPVTALFSTSIAAVLLGLGGCSSGGSGGSGSSGLYDGTWQGSCVVDGTGSEREVYTLSGSRFTLTDSFYGSPGCGSAGLEIVTSGVFTISGQTTISTGAMADNADVNVENVSLRYLNQPSVDNANSAMVCGRTDWEVDVSVDTTTCSEFSDTVGTIYDLVFVVDDILYFGDQPGIASSPENRPSDIDFTDGYQRTSN